jgi:hypothetical protein
MSFKKMKFFYCQDPSSIFSPSINKVTILTEILPSDITQIVLNYDKERIEFANELLQHFENSEWAKLNFICPGLHNKFNSLKEKGVSPFDIKIKFNLRPLADIYNMPL